MYNRYANFGGRGMHKHLPLILLIALFGLPSQERMRIQLMYVQTAEALKADGKTLQLLNVGQQTLYFSDRPVRIAGHLTMAAHMDEWKASEGPDNFGGDPPNATLTAYPPGATTTRLPWSRSVIRHPWEGPRSTTTS